MMLLLLTALAAQAVTLPANDREAAITCGAATIDSSATTSEPDVVGNWFMMAAVKADKSKGTLPDQMPGLTAEIQKRAPTLGAQRTAVVAQCRRRFPRAYANSGVSLPADGFARMTMCFTTASYLGGLYDGGPIASDKQRADALGDRLSSQIQPDFDRRGLHSTESMVAVMLGALESSLDYGNLAGILAACETAYPA